MSFFTKMTVGACALAAVAAPALAVTAPAHAAGRHWTTTMRFEHAKLQQCRVGLPDHSGWRVYNRLDARKATEPLTATVYVTVNDTPSTHFWRVMTKPHTLSKVGTVTLKKKAGRGLAAGIGGGQSGDGGPESIRDIAPC
ncbi:MAG: hypothetical protein ACTHNS_01030 [Marmoricola sp.]